MAALSVRVLGDFSIDGIDTPRIGDRKARQVARWLALARGRAVTADALADALWGDTPPARPADQISVLASRLRRSLGPEAVSRGDGGYRLGYDWLDLDELARILAEVDRRREAGNEHGAAAAARVGLALVRGTIPDCGTEAAWVRADQAAAERLVRRLRQTAATALLASGEWRDALDLAQEDARADPYDEEALRLVMRANHQGGRPAVALAEYAALRARLADELGTDPDSATSDLHTAILRGAPAATPRRREVPVTLVGRASQLDHLDRLADTVRAAEPRARVALVRGEAGIGKTTLLRAWTQRRSALGDTVLFGTCGALERSAPLDSVLVALGEHLRRSPEADALLARDAALLAPLLGLERVATSGTDAIQPEAAFGTAGLFAALTSVIGRMAAGRCVVLVVDDAHLAGGALAEWVAFAVRRPIALLVVVAARPGEGEQWPGADLVNLGPLDRAATAELVGPERADRLYARSLGHPLFLSALSHATDEELPATLIASVDDVCTRLGHAGDLLRTAAVLGTELDVDLLASVLGRPALEVLADIELAEARQLLVEDAGRYSFRHELVREALAGGARSARAALVHREAAVALARRPAADPLVVAEHARLGGDLALAASSLHTAGLRAAERFDHDTAQDLLESSLRLAADDDTRLALARVRIRRGRYADAEADVLAAPGSGPAGSEVRAWAAYFDRRFDDAVGHARDGELAADDPALQARCQIVGGRTLHAHGDLDEAETLLVAATDSATGPDRITAAAWLGVLEAHRSRPDRALALLRPAAAPGVGADHTSATLHALLFIGHAHALAGRPWAALDCFRRYTDEVDHRHVPRFAGRGVNFGGWVLRNVGAMAAAREAHEEALDCAGGVGTPELRIAALEDLAEHHLVLGDAGTAGELLREVATALADRSGGDLVFGWRLVMKHQLLAARTALSAGDPIGALATAEALADAAGRVRVPRYAATARLLAHQARALLGEPVDLARAWSDLAEVETSVATEAWWWAGETGAALGEDRWLVRADELVAALAPQCGPHADDLAREAARRRERWLRRR